MKVLLTGGTGFIGRALVDALLAEGQDVVLLSRARTCRTPEGVRTVTWPVGRVWNVTGATPDCNPADDTPGAGDAQWREALDNAEVVVNLAGEPIAARRWNKIQKERIRQSRVQGTRNLINALALAKRKPRVLISGSAVGYYGPRENGMVAEAEGPGRDFLSGVCWDWEQEALRAEELGIRVVLLRTGLVLGPGGGALPRLLMPFRLFMGGPLGSGRQWMPWIHLQDMVDLILFLINNGQASGPFNAVAPNPVTNTDFSRTLGRVMGRPSLFRAPAPLLRLALGEMAGALLLSGQRAIPSRALELGYKFRYSELEPALRSILARNNTDKLTV
ncbi:MAG: hypothetical protein VR69_12365 [Peptococcaceae bacterium BRH_c4b]|nr:MAG: hypothetical protein VR69_12365 [Peptococcaceae bacterium BRH_c4b]